MQIKHKLILHLIALLVLTGVISIGALFYSSYVEQRVDVEKTLRNQERLFELHKNDKFKIMAELAQTLGKRVDIVDAFEKRDSKALTELLNPIYSRFKNIQISYFYLILPDKSVLLRLHNPDKSGDIITRFGLNSAVLANTPYSGIEAGIKANIVLRHTQPIYKNSKLIGYIELGEELGNFFEELALAIDSDIALLVAKERIDANSFQELQLKNPKKYRALSEYVVAASSLCDTAIIHEQTMQSKFGEIVHMSTFGAHTSSKEFIDASGAVIGKLVFIEKGSAKRYADLAKVISFSTFLILSLSTILFFFYYRYVNKISDLIKSQYDELELKATTDHLTGLYNRRYLNEIINIKFATAKRFNQNSVFIMIDIDNFKLYNDNYGHDKGDEVLIKVAQAIVKQCKRSTDIVVRMGGEEFGVFSMFEDSESVANYVNMILTTVRETNIKHAFNNPYSVITVSIGYSVCPANESKTFALMYEQADKALYHSKSLGKNRATNFDEIAQAEI